MSRLEDFFLDLVTRNILGYLTSVEVTSLVLLGQNEGRPRSDVTIVANLGDLPILLAKDLGQSDLGESTR